MYTAFAIPKAGRKIQYIKLHMYVHVSKSGIVPWNLHVMEFVVISLLLL